MAKGEVSVKLGKHRLYTCQCGFVRGVAIPPPTHSLRPCTNCGADILIQPSTVEDIAVRRRNEESK